MSDSHGEEIWKWDDCQKRLEFARQWTKEAGPDSGDVRLDGLVNDLNVARAEKMAPNSMNNSLRWELQNIRRLYESKSIECARLQKRVEELEGR